jgi:hypothetical protein
MTIVSHLPHVLAFHFWPIWFAGLAGILTVSIWMHQTGLRPLAAGTPVEERAKKPGIIPVICFAGFLILYLVFMLWKEDFTYEDGHHWTDYSAIGVTRPVSVWLNVGRYWPIGYTEYNFISHLSKTATAYATYSALQLLAGLWLLYKAMENVEPVIRLCMFAFLMLAPAFGADFCEITYADRNVVFALCILVYCVNRYDRRPSLTLTIISIVAVSYALYCKEMSAALFGTFAASRILLKASREGWKSALRSPLEIGIVLAVAFFAVQLAIVLINGVTKYISDNFVGRGTATFRYLTADPLLSVFLIVFAVHVVRTLRQGKKFDLLWDTLAAGAVLHFCAVSVTGVEEDYLMGPTELVAALTLVRVVPAWWSEQPRLRPILGGIAAVLAFISICNGSYRLIERKNIVIQTTRLGDFLAGYYRTPGRQVSRLYMRADLTEMGLDMNFASYLWFRGIPVDRADRKRESNTVEIAGPPPYPDDLCVDYTPFKCRHSELRKGDLLVHIPEELAPPPDLPDGTTLQPLFESLPASSFPALRPLLAALYRVTPNLRGVYHGAPLPDDWLRVAASQVQ